MPSKDNKRHRLNATKPKRIRRITTVEDLLATDNVNHILDQLNEVKPNISDMVVIWLDKRDNRYYYQITQDTMVSMATWLLESTKLDVLSEGEE